MDCQEIQSFDLQFVSDSVIQRQLLVEFVEQIRTREWITFLQTATVFMAELLSTDHRKVLPAEFRAKN